MNAAGVVTATAGHRPAPRESGGEAATASAFAVVLLGAAEPSEDGLVPPDVAPQRTVEDGGMAQGTETTDPTEPGLGTAAHGHPLAAAMPTRPLTSSGLVEPSAPGIAGTVPGEPDGPGAAATDSHESPGAISPSAGGGAVPAVTRADASVVAAAPPLLETATAPGGIRADAVQVADDLSPVPALPAGGGGAHGGRHAQTGAESQHVLGAGDPSRPSAGDTTIATPSAMTSGSSSQHIAAAPEILPDGGAGGLRRPDLATTERSLVSDAARTQLAAAAAATVDRTHATDVTAGARQRIAEPFAAQMSRPVLALAHGTSGAQQVTVHVTPEHLGPVSVRAIVSPDGVRIELFAPVGSGREALRQVLGDLRRDVVAAGLTATVDISPRDAGTGSPEHSPARDERHEPDSPAPRQPREEPSRQPQRRIPTSALDVIA